MTKNWHTDSYVFKTKEERLADEIAETKRKLNLQTDVMKKEPKDPAKQQNERSAAVLKAKKPPEVEVPESVKSKRFIAKKPIENDVFIDKKQKPKSIEELDEEQDSADNAVADQLLETKFADLKKKKRQFRS